MATAPVPFRQRIDTDVRRARIRVLTEALYSYLTVEIDEMEDAARAAALNPAPAYPSYSYPPPSTEIFMATAEQVEHCREQLATIEEAERTLPKEFAAAAVIARVMLQEQLHQAETTLSQMQKAMEDAAARLTPDPSKV